MEVIILNSEAFEQLKREFKTYVAQAVADVLAAKKLHDQSDWITIEEAKALLNFKSKTSWQKLRNSGTIKFSQYGRKIMYSKSSIQEYINKNTI